MSANLKRRMQLRTLVCPQCGAMGLKRIIYGMPDEDFPFENYIVGGCIMSEATWNKDVKQSHTNRCDPGEENKCPELKAGSSAFITFA